MGYALMTKKEKLVMRFLCEICPKKRTYLVSPHDIAIALSKKFVLSTSEIDEIMQELSFENYIDFVATEGKNGYYYCVTLKKRGLSFEFDQREKKKTFAMLVLRSIFLATVSFVFGLVLKAIFTH